MARKKVSIENDVWFTIDRSNIDAVRKALPKVESARSMMGTGGDDGQKDPFDEANGQVIGVAECRIVEHPSRGRIVFVMYGDGIACMLNGDVITWAYESMRADGKWLFECAENGIVGYDENGNEVAA